MAENKPLVNDHERTVARRTLEALLKGVFLDYFYDDKTVEMMINPDGRVFCEQLGIKGMKEIMQMQPDQVEQIIRTVSGYHNQVVSDENAICEAEFPLLDARFEGILKNILTGNGPAVTIRKKASLVFKLAEYVKNKIMTAEQMELLQKAIHDHLNILVVGGTGSGKTTLINAIIAEIVAQFPNERIYMIEDTGELQCTAHNFVQTRADRNHSMTMLVKTALRMRPDRILVGEVRNKEALDVLEAWNTGHPGGCATLHASSAYKALMRLKLMIARNKDETPPEWLLDPMIADSVDIIVNIQREERNPMGREIKEILRIEGFDEKKREYILSSYQ